VVFIDAIHVKIRDGQVANRPIYVALAVTVDGGRDILGLWAGDGGEGAKFWLRVLTEIKNRGAGDVCMVVCDGLKGLPDAIGEVWPQAVVQTCLIHLIRASLRYASKADWAAVAKDLKPVYTAPSEQAALDAFAEFSAKWERKYPAIVRLWTNAWPEMVPFLAFDVEIRRIVCSTDEIVKSSLLDGLVWVASGRRGPGRRVRPARRRSFLGGVVACRCRPRREHRSYRVGTGRRR
jgi:putative transposase